jgi:hypothetical protein
VDQTVVDVIARCVVRDPKERIASADAIIAGLGGATSSSPSFGKSPRVVARSAEAIDPNAETIDPTAETMEGGAVDVRSVRDTAGSRGSKRGRATLWVGGAFAFAVVAFGIVSMVRRPEAATGTSNAAPPPPAADAAAGAPEPRPDAPSAIPAEQAGGVAPVSDDPSAVPSASASAGLPRTERSRPPRTTPSSAPVAPPAAPPTPPAAQPDSNLPVDPG